MHNMNKADNFWHGLASEAARSLEQELECDLDPAENKLAELKPWQVKSVNIFMKGVTGSKLDNKARFPILCS